MEKGIYKEWNDILKEEAKYLLKEEKRFKKYSDTSWVAKVEQKIPAKAQDALEKAFYQAFEKTFIHGEALIDKTVSAEEIILEFDVNEYRITKSPTQKSFQILDKAVARNQKKNTHFATVEGIGLGVAGVSLFDIPIFLGVMLKAIYETALGYGFAYKSDKEKVYILRLMVASLEYGDEKRAKDFLVEQVVFDENGTYDLKEEMRLTAKQLTKQLLVAKFIQGFFVVGAVGGAMSVQIYQQILKYATLKYKKRYLYAWKNRISFEKK